MNFIIKSWEAELLQLQAPAMIAALPHDPVFAAPKRQDGGRPSDGSPNAKGSNNNQQQGWHLDHPPSAALSTWFSSPCIAVLALL
jgi:hypothetical protein